MDVGIGKHTRIPQKLVYTLLFYYHTIDTASPWMHTQHTHSKPCTHAEMHAQRRSSKRAVHVGPDQTLQLSKRARAFLQQQQHGFTSAQLEAVERVRVRVRVRYACGLPSLVPAGVRGT